METIRLGPMATGESFISELKWDEKGHNVISHIVVNFDTNGIRSIQFGYLNNGVIVVSKQHGSSSSVDCSSRVVRLKHDTEFVNGISGETHNGFITSLTFHTNLSEHKAIHLTFRVVRKIELKSGIFDRCEFGGFFGTYNKYNLTSIGFHVNLVILPDVKHIKKEKA
ncbi:unnamed protein product [Cochlearia groenlandica]